MAFDWQDRKKTPMERMSSKHSHIMHFATAALSMAAILAQVATANPVASISRLSPVDSMFHPPLSARNSEHPIRLETRNIALMVTDRSNSITGEASPSAMSARNPTIALEPRSERSKAPQDWETVEYWNHWPHIPVYSEVAGGGRSYHGGMGTFDQPYRAHSYHGYTGTGSTSGSTLRRQQVHKKETRPENPKKAKSVKVPKDNDKRHGQKMKVAVRVQYEHGKGSG